MDFLSRNGFFAEDKGSQGSSSTSSFFSAFSTSSAEMPELHCSMAASKPGEVEGRAVTPLNITEQVKRPKQSLLPSFFGRLALQVFLFV